MSGQDAGFFAWGRFGRRLVGGNCGRFVDRPFVAQGHEHLRELVQPREARGLPADPMDAFRQSGYLEKITAQRSAKNMAAVSSYA